MWCKVDNFVKIYMLRLRASDLGIGVYILFHSHILSADKLVIDGDMHGNNNTRRPKLASDKNAWSN